MPFDKENLWRPNIKQEKFLALPDSIREAGYLGGAGSGKSELLLMLPIVRGWYKNSKFKQVFLRRSFPELRNEIVPRSREIYKRFGATFNKTDMCWSFPSGALIFLGHCENESDAYNFDSMEINLFTPDEVTSLTEFMYLYIGFTRVRTNDKELPAIIRCAGMPGGIGHSWVKKRFVDPYPSGNKKVIGKGGNSRIMIVATLADNKEHIDPAYSQSLEALPEAEKNAKKYGDWNAYSGQVFDEFRDRQYPDEPPNAIHIIPEFTIPTWWPKIVAIDWGFSAMCSIGFGAISPNKKLYVYRHLMFYGKKIEEWCSSLKPFVDKEQPSDIVICHSAGQNRGDPHTILQQVEEALGTSVRLGERDRIGGKMLLHEYLRWRTKPIPINESGKFNNELASWLLRNKGLESYNDYLKSFNPSNEIEDIPRLQFFDTEDVRVICDAIKACVYEKSGKDGKKQEDVAEFNGDDPYDQLRMLLHAADAFFNVAGDIQNRLARTDAIVEQLARTGDQTNYYRNMRSIENRELIAPLKRYHGSRHVN